MEEFREQAATICDTYFVAEQLEAEGTHVVSCDEKTGMQAKEQVAAALPVRPGTSERLEFEYERHGTLCLMANLVVATGRIEDATIGPTRTEKDFEAHIAQTIDSDPDAGWIFIVDQLNTHMSEALVRLVAERCSVGVDLGRKEKSGILKTMSTRAAFLSDTDHRIRFIYTPKHCSWLNQVEIWFSILARRLLKRASFTSTQHLRERLRAFIKYFNAVLAKPFKWTYTGRPA